MKLKTHLETPEGIYTISTCQLSKSPMPEAVRLITLIGDQEMENEADTWKDFETMLFLNDLPAPHPFGDLPGNELQGVYQRYATKEEAQEGHSEFVTRVKAILAEKDRK